MEVKQFENLFLAIDQSEKAIPKLPEILGHGQINWGKGACSLKAWLFNPKDTFKRWSLARDECKYPHKEVPMDDLISYDCPTPLWSFDSLIPAELGDERNFITRVHNWVVSLDAKSDKPDVINIWASLIIKGTAGKASYGFDRDQTEEKDLQPNLKTKDPQR